MDEGPSLKKKSYEQLVVNVIYETRPIIPAIKLEKKEIKMTRPPDTVPCIVTVTEEESEEEEKEKESIVGETDPLEEEDETKHQQDVALKNGHAETSKEADKPGSRLTVQFAEQSSTRRSSQNVMEFFEEQEKSFREQMKLLPKPKKHRSPSPSPLRQSVGLDHLDNLVKLMEQLSTLRNENSRLKNRCEYLESTKDLLQLKSNIAGQIPLGYSSLPKQKAKLRKSNTDPESQDQRKARQSRSRLRQQLNVEDEDLVESSSDRSPKRPKAATLLKRSYSTGSIDVPSEIIEEEIGITKSSKIRKEITKHKKSKSSKWARVKKVFYEDLGSSIKSLREFGKGATQLRYTGIGSPSELSPPTPRGHEGRSLDSGVSSSMDGQGLRMSTSSTEAPSPSRSPNQTTDIDLCTDVWMGPPEWLQKQREERGESSCSGVSSDVSSVIEIKSIYLGKDSTGSEKYLKVKPKLARRRSSPTLVSDLDVNDESLEVAQAGPLHRSSSYKSETDSVTLTDDVLTVRSLERESKKQKTAWKRVKDIIHIRKDSTKKKKHRSDQDGNRSEETSEIDMEALREEHFGAEIFGEGVISRSTPKTSPIIVRPLGPSHSDLAYIKTPLSRSQTGPPSPGMDLAALMASGVSDEFNKKLQEWEDQKSRKSIRSSKGAVDESDTFSQDSSRSSELDRSKGREAIRKLSGEISEEFRKPGDVTSDEDTSEDIVTADTTGASVNVDDLQRRITESFSRKLQEWERIKYRRDTKEGEKSPEIQRKESKIRREDRAKSKKSREEREKEKMEKLREREMQKVEREQVKLDKEKMRLEKDRLRALEREAKLEKMKGRLSQTDSDPMFKNPVLSPLAEYKVTADFAHKLHEWELRKGLSHDISTAIYLEAQKRSIEQVREGLLELPVPQPKHERSKSDSDVPIPDTDMTPVPVTESSISDDGRKPPPLTLHPYWGTPEPSPIEKTSELSDDNTSITEDSMITRSNIHSLERANAQLLQQLAIKEEESARIIVEVKQLNLQLETARGKRIQEQAQLHRKSENGAGLAAVSFEPMSVASTVVDLEEKILQLQTLGENLADSMESAAVGKLYTVEGEGSVSSQLMEMVDKMKDMLSHASQTEEASQKSSALHDFEKLYSQAMTLQVQMNNLRLSHLERNKEIMEIKRQLLLQEVNNLMLQVDITRRESELYQYHEDDSLGQECENNYTQSEGASKDNEGEKREITDQLQTEHDDPDGETIQHIPLATVESLEPEASSKKKGHKKEKQVKEKKEKKSKLFHSKSSKKDTKSDQSKKAKKKSQSDSEESHKKSSAMERSLELCCSSVLPTATVSLPRDLSETETIVPKVEKGSPTLAKSKLKQTGFHQEESKKTVKRVTYETPEKPIPESQQIHDKPKLIKTVSVVDDEYSPQTVTDSQEQHVDSSDKPKHSDEQGQPSGTITRAEAGQATLIPSPVIRSKYPHTRGESKGLDKENSRCASPKPILKHSQPIYKPPLPKQSTPLTHSPVLIHSVKNGSRSKSVDEVTSRKSELSEREPGHVMFSIQDKRATVCEIDQHVLELRKTPSPTLYLPRVGLVTPVRRLKPAAELLEESQRYRKGHSVFTQRILQRYQQKEEQRLRLELTQRHDKENISGIYTKSALKKSREGTPVKVTDSSSITSLSSRTDSHHHVEFVQSSRTLPSSSGSDKPKSSAPFKDLTNGGQLSEKYVIDSPERTLSESVLQTISQTNIPKMKRRSCEVGVSYDPSSTTASYIIVSTASGSVAESAIQPESTISTINHSSMPTLSTTQHDSIEDEPGRDRSATYAASSSRYGGKDDIIESIGTCRARPTTTQSGPIFSSSTSRSPILKHSGGDRPTSPKSPDRRTRSKMGTIGVLCKQSISFDLGVSLHTPSEGAIGGRQRDSTGSTSPPSTSRPTSTTSSEGEVASTSKDEKKKQRSKFLDSKWLQKPKKFFKVSK